MPRPARLALAPLLLVLGLYIPNPATMGSALAVLMGFSNALALQETFSADFASFLNGNLGQFVGLLFAIVVTAALRSMGVDASARRLAWLRACGWVVLLLSLALALAVATGARRG